MNIILSSLVGNSLPLLQNPFFYLTVLVIVLIVFLVITSINRKKLDDRNNEIVKLQQQHVAKIDAIRKEHVEKINELNKEMLKKEEDRSRQWQESEKETMLVLNGVSQLLELSESISRIDSEKIMNKLDELKQVLVNGKDNHEKTGNA